MTKGLVILVLLALGAFYYYASWKAKTLVTERIKQPKEEPTPREVYDGLLNMYYHTVSFVEGTGDRGQPYIDRAYERLVRFAEEHPGEDFPLPKMQRSRDDGTGGFATGLSAAASRSKSRSEEL